MGSVEEQNKALARRYYGDIMNGGRLDVIDELTTPDFFFSIPTHPKPFYGPQGLKDEVTMLHGAFPDVHIQVELLLAEGDQVVGHWTGTGTHTGGPLPTKAGDIPASGSRSGPAPPGPALAAYGLLAGPAVPAGIWRKPQFPQKASPPLTLLPHCVRGAPPQTPPDSSRGR